MSTKLFFFLNFFFLSDIFSVKKNPQVKVSRSKCITYHSSTLDPEASISYMTLLKLLHPINQLVHMRQIDNQKKLSHHFLVTKVMKRMVPIERYIFLRSIDECLYYIENDENSGHSNILRKLIRRNDLAIFYNRSFLQKLPSCADIIKYYCTTDGCTVRAK